MRFWIFLIGVGLAVLVGVGDATDTEPGSWRKPRKGESAVRLGYWFFIINLYCALQFPEWRAAIAKHGVSNLWSWVLAPLGLIFVVAASIIAGSFLWGENAARRLVWIPALGVYLGAAIAYGRVSGAPSWGHSWDELAMITHGMDQHA